MKRLRPHLYKCKWLILYVKQFFTVSSFRRLVLKTEITEKNASHLSETLRKLLQKNPRWKQGHYLLGLLSFTAFQNTKDGRFKGTLQTSLLALRELKEEGKYVNILNMLSDFIDKRYEDVFLLNVDLQELSPNKNELFFLHEIKGLACMILGKDPEAKDHFFKIPKSKQSNEIKSAIQNLSKN